MWLAKASATGLSAPTLSSLSSHSSSEVSKICCWLGSFHVLSAKSIRKLICSSVKTCLPSSSNARLFHPRFHVYQIRPWPVILHGVGQVEVQLPSMEGCPDKVLHLLFGQFLPCHLVLHEFVHANYTSGTTRCPSPSHLAQTPAPWWPCQSECLGSNWARSESQRPSCKRRSPGQGCLGCACWSVCLPSWGLALGSASGALQTDPPARWQAWGRWAIPNSPGNQQTIACFCKLANCKQSRSLRLWSCRTSASLATLWSYPRYCPRHRWGRCPQEPRVPSAYAVGSFHEARSFYLADFGLGGSRHDSLWFPGKVSLRIWRWGYAAFCLHLLSAGANSQRVPQQDIKTFWWFQELQANQGDPQQFWSTAEWWNSFPEPSWHPAHHTGRLSDQQQERFCLRRRMLCRAPLKEADIVHSARPFILLRC